MKLSDFRFIFAMMTPTAKTAPVSEYRTGQFSQVTRLMIAAAKDGILTVRKVA